MMCFFQVESSLLSVGLLPSINIIRRRAAKLLSYERLGTRLNCLSSDSFFFIFLRRESWERPGPHRPLRSNKPGGAHVRSLAPCNEEQMQQCCLLLSHTKSLHLRGKLYSYHTLAMFSIALEIVYGNELMRIKWN